MTDREHYTLHELAEAYRILREAFAHPNKPKPETTPLQERVQTLLAQPIQK